MIGNRDPSSTANPWFIAFVLGLLLAFWQQHWTGLIIGGLLGYLLGQVQHLRRRVERLTGRMRSAVAEPKFEPEAVESEPRSKARVIGVPASPEPAIPPAPEPVAAAASPWRTTMPLPLDQWIAKAVAWLRGGNPLARTG